MLVAVLGATQGFGPRRLRPTKTGSAWTLDLFSRNSTGVRLTVAALSDVGQSRTHNEDRYLVADLTSMEAFCDTAQRTYKLGPKGALLLVADGMGGALSGEVASQMAADFIFQQLTTAWVPDPDASPEAFALYLRRSVEDANARIHAESTERPELNGMGTTATLVGVLGSHLVITQVGDSRAYMVRDGVATQLSRDQSYVQELVDTGKVSEEEAHQMTNHNVILQALGPDPTVDVVQGWEPIVRGDIVVVCSDGLSGLVGADEIAEAMARRRSLPRACENLVKMANARGGPDNITVIAARMTGDGLPARPVGWGDGGS